MNFYIGVTDPTWFQYLNSINPEDVNFWQPGGQTIFRAINPGDPFLFKLKKPFNAIAGVGFFSTHSLLPISVAWDIFGNRNGLDTFEEFYSKIHNLRSHNNLLEQNPNIGCIVLTNPIFFKKEDWITIPSNWSSSIVQGKSYSIHETIGKNIWEQVQNIITKYQALESDAGAKSQLIFEEPNSQYTRSILTKVRLGQGAFRVMITDAYQRKCAVTGERTLPVLEAAHIKPYAKSGPHFISNGLLLRSDIHKLFDNGYVTISPELKVEVSKKLKEEFSNGKEYYKFHGSSIIALPNKTLDKPSGQYIEWHNNNIYKG